MKKIHSHNSGTGREWKKPIPIIREREGNEKKAFPKFGNGKGMKKSIPIIRERESEAFILGNGREREFPLTPALFWNVSLNTCLRMNWRVEISFLQRSPICASYTWENILHILNMSGLGSPPYCKYQKGSSKRRWNCPAIPENRLYWRGSTPRGQ